MIWKHFLTVGYKASFDKPCTLEFLRKVPVQWINPSKAPVVQTFSCRMNCIQQQAKKFEILWKTQGKPPQNSIAKYQYKIKKSNILLTKLHSRLCVKSCIFFFKKLDLKKKPLANNSRFHKPVKIGQISKSGIQLLVDWWMLSSKAN